MPRHKFGAIAKSGFDIISKPSSIGRIGRERDGIVPAVEVFKG